MLVELSAGSSPSCRRTAAASFPRFRSARTGSRCDRTRICHCIPGRLAWLSAKLPGGTALMRRTLTVPSLRRLPITFGWMSKRGIPDDLMRRWLAPLARRPIRRDLIKYAGDA